MAENTETQTDAEGYPYPPPAGNLETEHVGGLISRAVKPYIARIDLHTLLVGTSCWLRIAADLAESEGLITREERQQIGFALGELFIQDEPGRDDG